MPYRVVALLLVVSLPAASRAGLYYSGESYNELPSQWRGFLLDQRSLRLIAVKPAAGARPGTVRARYEDAAAKLEEASRQRKLTADEAADLGALHLRLGDPAKAVEVLRAGQRDYPNHFRIAANLGTAWQQHGDLAQAVAALQQAVRLAPGKWQRAEDIQLRLVRLRQGEPKGSDGLDDLFGVRYVGEGGGYEPGRLAASEGKKLPADAVALVQQLALWLPADGRLLWQLGELAGAHGDVRTAANILEGCVGEFGLRAPELRQHRQAARTAAEQAAQAKAADKLAHEAHAGLFKPRSARPLAAQLDQAALPPIDAAGLNALPWSVVAATTIDRRYRPTFPKYLQQLNGKLVTLSGYLQPLGDDPEGGAFMLIENPVGCWYCEMPDMTGIVFVELPAGQLHRATRDPVKVTGKLKLNDGDPESFLYTISEAKVVPE